MNKVTRLWWFAQIEIGVERADIEREPVVGSEKVIEWLTDEMKYNSSKTNLIYINRRLKE